MASKVVIFLFLVCCAVYSCYGLADFIRPGGLSEEYRATEFIKGLALKMKRKAECYLKKEKPFKIFEAESYKSQVVAGTNYFIKVNVGDNKYIHLRVYEPLPFAGEKPMFSAAKGNKNKHDKIEYFEEEVPKPKAGTHC